MATLNYDILHCSPALAIPASLTHLTPTMCLSLWSILLTAAIVGITFAEPAVPQSPEPARIDFQQSIAPLFSQFCYRCHADQKQKGGLRLDLKQPAFAGGDSGPVIVAGKSGESLLYRYIAGLEDGKTMPPSGPKPSAAQVASIRKWIDQGANWPEKAPASAGESWWSLAPLKRPSIPKWTNPADAAWVRNPVDAFILAKLKEKGLPHAPEADRRTLVRRLFFDLTGLPPTPEEVDQFVADPDPQAYEKRVDRLLNSPRYGERWARHWLDVVHYGETHGYDKDKPRPNAWPYRDYVIRAFNEDKPYGRFVQEQLAGDVLYPGSRDGVEALGFIAAGPWDFIGHAELPESKTDGQIARHLDRDDMVANTINTFQSLTVHCAQCHNHKFDPISMEDYYSLQAVFAALDRADKAYDLDPAITRQRAELLARRKILQTEKESFDAKLKLRAGPRLQELDRQIAQAAKPTAAQRAEFGYHSAIESSSAKTKWVQLDLGQVVPIAGITYVGCYDDFNHLGAGFGFPPRFKIELSDDPEFQRNVHLAVDHSQTAFANPGTQPQEVKLSSSARFVRFTALQLAPRQNDFIFALAELSVLDQQGKNWARQAKVTALDSIEAPPRWSKKNLVDGILPPNSFSKLAELKQERERLIQSVMTEDLQQQQVHWQSAIRELEADLKKLPPPHYVYAGTVYSGSGSFVGTGAAGGKPRSIYLLPRGNVKTPGKEVGPGALEALHHAPSRFAISPDQPEGERRAQLARWITHPDNPLTWRSIVNRVWLYHFGRGIVDTPNDFGKMGQLPTHPELLDWLALEFRDQGQSLKKLHRLLVTSSAYRQASHVARDSEATKPQTLDANNAYYWRMSRRRLEAEAVHDSILAVSGRLDLRMGGPSFQDYVIDKPEHSPHYEYHLFDPDNPTAHRRSIYRSIVRSQQQPWMAALDCADPSLLVEKRNQSLSPLQALALLNNDLVLVMAKHFAERVRGAGDLTQQVRLAFRLALQREPAATELQALVENARELGLDNTCRVLLNLNEFVFVD
jgi:hypothetical protein